MGIKYDLIDRQALIDVFAGLVPYAIDGFEDAAYARGLDAGYQAVVEAPAVDVRPQWIDVKDRLPDTYKAVITYDKYGGVKENWLLKSTPCVSWSVGFHVTHWMPLPEPPKEDE